MFGAKTRLVHAASTNPSSSNYQQLCGQTAWHHHRTTKLMCFVTDANIALHHGLRYDLALPMSRLQQSLVRQHHQRCIEVETL